MKLTGWKLFIAAALAGALAILPATAAQKTPAQLAAENQASFPDNSSKFITPLLLRTFHQDVVDSYLPISNILAPFGYGGAFLTLNAFNGDCSSLPNSVTLTCTKTGGVAFRTIATSASASDLISGTVNSALLPAATNVTIGAVKPGTGLAVAGDGTLSFGTIAANSLLGNATAGVAAPSALALVDCHGPSQAINFAANGGGGFGCATITATGFVIPASVSGTVNSGGIPYFNSITGMSSSATLAANALMVGGGAGVAPSTITTGAGVPNALGVNVGSAGAFVVNGGALGTPSSGTLTNATGLPILTGVSGLGANVATALTNPANGAGGFLTSPVSNGNLANSSITLNAGASVGLTAPGAMTLGSTYTIGATTDKPQFTALGLGAAAPTNGVTMAGSTSGTLQVKPAAVAGTGSILTLPGGTTDFSATGGASQVVKQTSAGAAFTVARLACADMSDAAAGCSQANAVAADVQAGTSTTKTVTPSALSGSAAPQTLTDGATISWDVSLGYNAKVTLGGNRTLAAPTNVVAGITYTLQVCQDATGSRTLTWNAAFNWGAAGTPTLTTTASKCDLAICFATAATPTFNCTISKGF